MAISSPTIHTVQHLLQKWQPTLKIEIRQQCIIATAKELKLTADMLNELSVIAYRYTITFGRSGANFRMIIS